MKLSMKITGVFLIFTLLTSCVAATENKDLPTKEEITDFIAGMSVSDNYINTVFDTVKDKQPTWNCDTWVDKKTDNQILSLYYVNPDSAEGYGSIYFNELGKEISKQGLDLKLVNHYVGKAVSEENTDNTMQTADETVQTADETDQNADDLLDEYGDDQSVKYNSPPIKYKGSSGEDDSESVEGAAQSVEGAAKSIKDAAQSVEGAAQSVEGAAQSIENDGATKKHRNILTDIFVAIVAGVILYYILGCR